MGKRLLSLKGDKATWSGVSRMNVNDRGRRSFSTLDNVYVSSDGQEIRSFPGYATFLDLSGANNALGYGRYVPDSVKPVLEYSSPNDFVRYKQSYDPTLSQTMDARAFPSHMFGFEQVGGEIVVIGESRFRECPIYNNFRARIDIASVSITVGVWTLTFTDTPVSHSFTDSGPGLNGLTDRAILYIEAINLPSSVSEADAALIRGDLVGKIHELNDSAPFSLSMDLTTLASGSLSVSSVNVDSSELHQIRPNRNNAYPATASGQYTPYVFPYDSRPDDPDALTSWRVIDAVDLSDSSKSGAYPCYPAWVANRQRDFGDGRQAGVTVANTEGIYYPSSSNRGYSRREQRRLPFRPNIETALDRVIIAAPQYGCMFQIPMKVPIDPSDWKTGGSSDYGIVYPNNGIYDKPRCLGIPKPRLIDVISATPSQPSPSDLGTYNQYTVMTRAVGGIATDGVLDGLYKLSVSFEDSGTGDEGLASEVIEFTVPSGTTYPMGIRINYIHPGYHFPESLCLRMNVYIAPPGSDALAFYGQFELAESDPLLATFSDPQAYVSGVYGLLPVTEDAKNALYRSFTVPLPSSSGDLEPGLDTTRLAPLSASMPRGASACKFIRGVLFSGGAMGNSGPDDQLWRSTATVDWAPDDFYPSDELNIRAHSLADASAVSSDFQDGTTEDVTLGIAGRAFPDAYQGIEFVSDELFPGGDSLKAVDKVLNRKVAGLWGLDSTDPAAFRYHHVERIKLQRNALNTSRPPGVTPDTFSGIVKRDKPIYYVMPRGQLQIGDPGAPNRSSKAFIKVVDPRDGGDITAIGQLGGSTIIATKKESYSYSWYRNPAGEEPNLLSNEFGCIGSNTMVEFDGGLAWLSSRGPVALGAGLQHIGADVAEDFYGDSGRYVSDSNGMMRHSWGVHDAQRGLIMWGLLRKDSWHSPRSLGITYEGQVFTTQTTGMTDKALSRFPCDEILIWSYNANAFSHWRPPAGLEVYWMRPIRDSQGIVRMCFLAADFRIYALDDDWSDANGVFNATISTPSALEAITVGSGQSTQTLIFGSRIAHQDGFTGDSYRRNFALLLRPGMLVEFLDAQGHVVSDTTISSVVTADNAGSESTITLASAQSWRDGQTIRIGGRQRSKIVTSFIGAETLDTMQVQRVQMRYATRGAGSANTRIKGFKSEVGTGDGEEARVIPFTQDGKWESLGRAKAGTTIPPEITSLGRRKAFSCGEASGQEIALQVEITGESQVRIQDLSLEVG